MTVVECVPIADTDQCAATFSARPWELLAAWTLGRDQNGYVYIPLCSFSVPGQGILMPLLTSSTPNPMFFMLKWDCGGAQGLNLDPDLLLYEQARQSFVSEEEYSGMTDHLLKSIDDSIGTYCDKKESGLSAPVDLSPRWFFDAAKPTTYTWYLRLFSSQPITQNLYIKTAGPWGFVFTPAASLTKQGLKLLKTEKKLRKKDAKVHQKRKKHAAQVLQLMHEMSVH
jgi:hypothetical protein